MTDYSELKNLAEAAPNGPWVDENDSLYFEDDGYTRHLLDADAGHDVEDEDYYAALSFVAAANPAVVLALIAENERLQESHEQVCTNYNQVSYASEERGKQIDQLKAENEALRAEAERLASHSRSNALDDASTICSRMAYEACYPKGSRYKYFTPKAQKALGDILIAAANRIAELPGGGYHRHLERERKKAERAAMGKPS
jgi:hypothetical protein